MLIVVHAIDPAWVAAQDAEERALELARAAHERYRAGDAAAAVELLLEARRVHSEPILLYNLARAYEATGELQRARAAYRRYLDEDPDATAAGAVRARIHAIDAELEERRRLAADAEAMRQRAERRRDPSAAPWLVGAGGLAALGAGAVAGAIALSRRDEALASEVHDTRVGLYEEARDLATVANVFYAVGAAVALTGLVWGIIDAVIAAQSGGPIGRAASGMAVRW